MFEPVTDIATLITRQSNIDKVCSDKLAAHKATHASMDEGDLIPSIVNRFSGGVNCVDCGCPTVEVESKSAGALTRTCREGINLMKWASLCHKNAFEICYLCKVKTNPNGMVAGAIHLTMLIEDQVQGGVRQKGFKSIIADGLVELDTDTDTVMIHDLTHTADQHCRGCIKVRHPGCPGVGVCDDAVENPA